MITEKINKLIDGTAKKNPFADVKAKCNENNSKLDNISVSMDQNITTQEDIDEWNAKNDLLNGKIATLKTQTSTMSTSYDTSASSIHDFMNIKLGVANSISLVQNNVFKNDGLEIPSSAIGSCMPAQVEECLGELSESFGLELSELENGLGSLLDTLTGEMSLDDMDNYLNILDNYISKYTDKISEFLGFENLRNSKFEEMTSYIKAFSLLENINNMCPDIKIKLYEI